MTYESNYKIPRLSFHMDVSAKKENEMDALSKEEQRLFKILSQVKGQSLFAISIRKRLQRRSLGSFREMIKELSEQARDARNELVIAIGNEGVEIIESLCS